MRAHYQLIPVQRRTFKQHVQSFDFIGLFLIMGAVVCLLVGFQDSENGWDRASVIAPIVASAVLFAAGKDQVLPK